MKKNVWFTLLILVLGKQALAKWDNPDLFDISQTYTTMAITAPVSCYLVTTKKFSVDGRKGWDNEQIFQIIFSCGLSTTTSAVLLLKKDEIKKNFLRARYTYSQSGVPSEYLQNEVSSYQKLFQISGDFEEVLEHMTAQILKN